MPKFKRHEIKTYAYTVTMTYTVSMPAVFRLRHEKCLLS